MTNETNELFADLPKGGGGGDRFFVPSTSSMVNVFGSVYSENPFVCKPEKRVADDLTQAGGPTRFVDQGGIYVLRADGSVISKRQFAC